MKTMSEFYAWKSATIKKHGGLEKTITGSMDEYGRYTKTYICSDGEIITEENGPDYRDVQTELGIMRKVKLFRSECYTTHEPNSMIFYELWNH